MMNKTLVENLVNVSKMSSRALTSCRFSSATVQNRLLQNVGKATTAMVQDPADRNVSFNGNGMRRRFFHRGAMLSPEMMKLLMEEDSMESSREIDMSKVWIRFDQYLAAKSAVPAVATLSALEAKKLLRAAQLEVVKTRLRKTGKNWISYPKFIGICTESCSDPEHGLQYARLLDESGTVVVLGDSVVLRPDRVAKALGGLIPLPGPSPNDPRRKELAELKKQKAIIDQKADFMVRRELWLGLAFLAVQTAGFMRLTFWELSWDVMEPICFYLTSMYFMAGYAFFLRTSKEPSFEGFYQGRFSARQKQLMKDHNFDVEKYNELKGIFFPHSSSDQPLSSASFDRSEKIQIGALDH